MTLDYSLSQDDYINTELFYASINKKLQERRRRSWLEMILLGFGLAVIDGIIIHKIPWICVIIAVAYTIGYPPYALWHDKRHYTKRTIEDYGHLFGKPTRLMITSYYLYFIHNGTEQHIDTTELRRLYDLPFHIVIEFNARKTGIIIPKRQLENISTVENKLRDIAYQHKAEFISIPRWRFSKLFGF